MIPRADSLAVDGRSLDRLKLDASRDPQGAVRQAAGQFEAMFMQMLLKSMRDAMPKSGMWDSPGEGMYQSMLDSQIAQTVSGRPGGLGEMIARQLSRNLPGAAPEVGALPGSASGQAVSAPAVPAAGRSRTGGGASAAADAAGADASGSSRAGRVAGDVTRTGIPLTPGGTVTAPGVKASDVAPSGHPRREATPASGRQDAFVQRLWQPALAAERATGVPASFIVGQAALETGWGRSEMRLPDGRPAHNLFGVKAGSSWKGETVEAVTTEYVDGRAVRTVAKFRAYGSYEEAFRDWAALIGNSPRYAQVVRAGGTVEGFAQGLQRAGYATDPNYADKLTNTINQALRIRRLVV